jgi:hypothetical protein
MFQLTLLATCWCSTTMLRPYYQGRVSSLKLPILRLSLRPAKPLGHVRSSLQLDSSSEQDAALSNFQLSSAPPNNSPTSSRSFFIASQKFGFHGAVTVLYDRYETGFSDSSTFDSSILGHQLCQWSIWKENSCLSTVL